MGRVEGKGFGCRDEEGLKKKEDLSVSKGWIRMMRGGVRVRCPGKLEEGLDKKKEELDKKGG